MKKFFILSLLAISSASFAQVTKNIGDFRDLKVYDRITVYLVKSDVNKVEITGKRSNEVQLVNSNGMLKVKMQFGKLLQGDDIEARVHYKVLESVDASEGSMISSENVIAQDEFEINAKEGSQVTLNVEVNDLEVRAVTGAIVSLKGRTDELDATLGTGGELKAKALVATKAEVAIRAGGQAEVYATDRIETDIKAGGDIVVYGNPAKVSEKASLGGTVTIKK